MSGRLYSTAEVDPLIAGQLRRHADQLRGIYAQRTAHDEKGWGLTEFSSSGGAGDVGVDIGPYGLDEYGGHQVGYDDGLPEGYELASTPIRWYRPARGDHYGPEGVTAYTDGLYNLSVPDHDPLVG